MKKLGEIMGGRQAELTSSWEIRSSSWEMSPSRRVLSRHVNAQGKTVNEPPQIASSVAGDEGDLYTALPIEGPTKSLVRTGGDVDRNAKDGKDRKLCPGFHLLPPRTDRFAVMIENFMISKCLL